MQIIKRNCESDTTRTIELFAGTGGIAKMISEIEIPGTITFQVMSVDGGNVPVGAGEVLLLRYSATHLEYSHELEDENQKFHMALHIIYCKEQKGLFGKVKYKTIKHRKEIITEADWENGKKVSLYED